MQHKLDFSRVRQQEIHRLSDKFFGVNPAGNEVGFTNYYMTVDGKPFFGISGECHFSRVAEHQWEDTILKMKAGGINIISTYIFWNHHEEIEGKFRFDGRRNLRKFVELCGKHGMYVIIRIGPFDHGEMRNGGLPDWLYGKPFEVRSVNEGFLHYVRLLYRAISHHVAGLLFVDGGPIIAAQLDNEYMHSAAPWEMTTGISNEWTNGGSDGEKYMLALKNIAVEEGIITPFYTCTGWGGAATPSKEMLPLWGGYAFWPWMFNGNAEYQHPMTPEYIYRDNHNNQVPETYNFVPNYRPEDMPYACCEMGGGMNNTYNYRFQLPYESVDAMANIKMASGCNFLGYYMYRGGSNPKGEFGTYMNENQCPKISYEYQAPLGEFGQIHPSYHRLRRIHLFAKHFGNKMSEMVTMLAEDNKDLQPTDGSTLRYAARTNGKEGFLFINNYQDHAILSDKINERIAVLLPDKEIIINNLGIASNENAILPINMDFDGLLLSYATAQPLSRIEEDNVITYYFYQIPGMKPTYAFAGEEIIEAKCGKDNGFSKGSGDKEIRFITLTTEESMEFYEFDTADGAKVIFSKDAVIFDGKEFKVEKIDMNLHKIETTQCGPSRFTFTVPKLNEQAKDTILKIDYSGDIGSIFNSRGELLADNFCNETTWEVGLREIDVKEGDVLTLYITPQKDDVFVDVSSTMAGRMEKSDGQHFELRNIYTVDTMEMDL